jgi:hypothetical protein
MPASAIDAVNAVCPWAHDEPIADFGAREERVLKIGRELLATWLRQLAGVAGPRSPEVRRPLAECHTPLA